MTNKVDFVEGNLALRFFSDRANWPWAVKDPRLCITLKYGHTMHSLLRKADESPRLLFKTRSENFHSCHGLVGVL
jgi:hypothetical protein